MDCMAKEVKKIIEEVKSKDGIKNNKNINTQLVALSMSLDKLLIEDGSLHSGNYDIVELSKKELQELTAQNAEYIQQNNIKVVNSNTFMWNNGTITVNSNLPQDSTEYQVFLAHEIIHDKTAKWIAANIKDKDVELLYNTVQDIINDIGTDTDQQVQSKYYPLYDRLQYGKGDETRYKQELVAVLAAEPTIRDLLIERYDKPWFIKLLNKIKQLFTGKEAIDAKYVLDAVNRIVKKAEADKTTNAETDALYAKYYDNEEEIYRPGDYYPGADAAMNRWLNRFSQRTKNSVKRVTSRVIGILNGAKDLRDVYGRRIEKIVKWVRDDNGDKITAEYRNKKGDKYVQVVNYIEVDGDSVEDWLDRTGSRLEFDNKIARNEKDSEKFYGSERDAIGLTLSEKEKNSYRESMADEYAEYSSIVDKIADGLVNDSVNSIFGFRVVAAEEGFETDEKEKEVILPVAHLKKAYTKYKETGSDYDKEFLAITKGIIAHELMHIIQFNNRNRGLSVERLEFEAHRAELNEYHRLGFSYEEAMENMFDGSYFFSEEELLTGIIDGSLNHKGYPPTYYSEKNDIKRWNSAIIAKAVGKIVSIDGKDVEVTDAGVYGQYLKIEADGRWYTFDPTTFKSVDGHTLKTKLFDGLRYGNTKQSSTSWSEYDRIEKNLFGDINAMQDLVDELNALDKSEDEEMVAYYKSLIAKIPAAWYRDIHVLIKEDGDRAVGMVQGSKMKLTVSKKKKITPLAKSNAEVYIHELLHTISTLALNDDSPKARRIRRELDYIMQEVVKRLHKHSFVDENADNIELEKLESEKLYEYIFNKDTGVEEFFVTVLSNKNAINVFKEMNIKTFEHKPTSAFQYLVKLFNDVLDFVTGKYRYNSKKTNVHDRLFELMYDIAEVNNMALNKARKSDVGLTERLDNALMDLETLTSNKIKNISASLGKKLGKMFDTDEVDENDTKTKRLFKMLGKYGNVLSHEKGLDVFLRLLNQIKFEGNWFKPWGDFQRILRDQTFSDAFAQTVEWLGLRSDKIDQYRNTIITAAQKNIAEAFKTPMTPAEEVSVTKALIRTNVQVLYKKYKPGILIDLLTDQNSLEKRIEIVKRKIKKKDKDWYNFTINQAIGLGYYMVTGKGHLAQNSNVLAIAKLVLTTERRKADKELVALIEELAALSALKYTDRIDKRRVAALWKREKTGIRTILNMHSASIKQSEQMLFSGSKMLMQEGYVKSIYDYNIDMKVGLASEEDRYKRLGYEKVYTLKSDKKYERGKVIYIKKSFESGGNWYRTAMRMNSKHSKGTTFSEIYNKEMIDESDVLPAQIRKLEADAKRLELIAKMQYGVFDVKEIENAQGVMPLLDAKGVVVDYRFIMPNHVKDELLEANLLVSDVLPRTLGSIAEDVETDKQNFKVFKALVQDYNENYKDRQGDGFGRNNKMYVEIREDSPYKAVRDIWKIMPKKYITIDKNHKVPIAVRADLLYDFFGFRHADLREVLPEFLKEKEGNDSNKVFNFIRGALNRMNKNGKLLKSTDFIETILHKLSGLVKVLILLKMPAVAVHNIVSNVLYAINSHTFNPLTLIRMYVDSAVDAVTYVRLHRKKVQLQIKLLNKPNDSRLKAQLHVINKRLKDNPIHELAKIGVYQAIQEDISAKELHSNDKFRKLLDEKLLYKMPKIVRDGFNIMFLTQETKYYKFMAETLQLSDLIARDVQNRRMKLVEQKQANGTLYLPRWWEEYKTQKKIDADYDDVINVTSRKEAKETLQIGAARRNGSSTNMEYKLRKEKLVGKEREEFFALAKTVRHNSILNSYINYNKASGKIEHKGNKAGFFRFTTFPKRIQKVIRQAYSEYPIRSILMSSLQGMFDDLDTVYNQFILTKNWYNFGFMPWDLVEEAAVIPLFREKSYDLY